MILLEIAKSWLIKLAKVQYFKHNDLHKRFKIKVFFDKYLDKSQNLSCIWQQTKYLVVHRSGFFISVFFWKLSNITHIVLVFSDRMDYWGAQMKLKFPLYETKLLIEGCT